MRNLPVLRVLDQCNDRLQFNQRFDLVRLVRNSTGLPRNPRRTENINVAVLPLLRFLNTSSVGVDSSRISPALVTLASALMMTWRTGLFVLSMPISTSVMLWPGRCPCQRLTANLSALVSFLRPVLRYQCQ